MRVFLAGAAGAVGRRLVPLLLKAGHDVVGTTRSEARARALRSAGVTPAVVDAFDAAALRAAIAGARPEAVIHQLTDLPKQIDPATLAAALESNTRLRIETTPSLMSAAKAAGVRRVIAQSICFVYAPGPGPRSETDPLDLESAGTARRSAEGVAALERAVLETPPVEGVVLRYGRLYGPGTWFEAPSGAASLHIDAAAHAALLALTRGAPGIYNIAEDDGSVTIDKARRELGFDPAFRVAA